MWKLRRPTVYNKIIPRLGRNELSTVKSRLKPLCSGFCEGRENKSCNKSSRSYPLSFLCVCIELQSQESMLDIRIFTSKVLLFSCQVSSMKKGRERERELYRTTLDKLHPKQSLRGCRVILLFWEWNRVKSWPWNSVQGCACVRICFESKLF